MDLPFRAMPSTADPAIAADHGKIWVGLSAIAMKSSASGVTPE